MATIATSRERVTLWECFLLALLLPVLLASRADGQDLGLAIYQGSRGDPTPSKAGDFYIVNNTDATISFSVSGITFKNPFNTTTIPPWGVAASTNIDLTAMGGDSGSGSLKFNIQAQANVPACTLQIGASVNTQNDYIYWALGGVTFSTVPTSPPYWTLSPSGAYTFDDYLFYQILNPSYVATLAVGLGNDSGSVYTGTKVLLVISQNTTQYPIYQLGDH